MPCRPGATSLTGDTTDRVYLVMSGFACRYKTLQSGTRRIVSFVLPGDLCYMHDTGPFGRDLRVGALTPCSVVDLSRSKLTELIGRYPGISRAIWWVTLRELSRAREWIVNDTRPADKRLAHTLCELLVCLQVIGLAGRDSFELPDIAGGRSRCAGHLARPHQPRRAGPAHERPDHLERQPRDDPGCPGAQGLCRVRPGLPVL